ncbi:extracellular solute-binding protein [Streptomyces solisilvae]|uniref:ABC transporter substrate-binding protein n=1 Tax=Streptomyces TaxID=1883 RepID=UPI001E3F1F6E|nr:MULTISPECIES: extracellular solute-binding protein [unclassified Streptomyces]MCD9586368.1 extracellular solute-binding protein [Streptomyces sp. 8ZJF_21]WHX23404.1 extracellular solute-binding protein [Streptomyces sp. NA07423]
MTHHVSRRDVLRSTGAAGLALLGGGLLSACGAPGGSSGGGTRLTMFRWAGAQGEVPKEVGDAFAKKNGVTVRYIEGTNAETFPKLVSSVQVNAHRPLLNLGFFNAQSFAQGAAEGLWAPVDSKLVPNAAKVLPEFRRDDGFGVYTVMDAMGILYNTDVVKSPPKSWLDLFKPEYRSKVTTWDAPAFAVNAVPVINKLKGGGEADLSKGIDVFADAAKKGQFAGLVASIDQLRKQLVSGQVVIAPGFQGVAQPWIDAGDPIGFAVPSEGVMAFPEGFQLVKGSSSEQLKEGAKLMNEILAPDAVSRYSAATATIPLIEGAELPARFRGKPGFQLTAVRESLQLDWGRLAKSVQQATDQWNSDVKAHL